MALGTASERFSAISELVSMLLHQADTITLIHCQRVCRTWTDIIKRSRILQETLFVEPQDHLADVTTQFEAVALNPVAETYFAPLLATSKVELSNGDSALQTRRCRSADLALLPWARDGLNMDAPARLAFARPEASWRKMFITQPPIHQVDWWHAWDVLQRVDERKFGTNPTNSGRGHARRYDKRVTLGMLYDFIEARLVRDCSYQLTLCLPAYPFASHPKGSTSEEFSAGFTAMSRRLIVAASGIEMHTHHAWHAPPSMYQRFDVQQGYWKVEDELPETPLTEDQGRIYRGWNCGFVWLNVDCKRDGEESNRRWSRSDDWSESWLTLRGVAGVPLRPSYGA